MPTWSRFDVVASEEADYCHSHEAAQPKVAEPIFSASPDESGSEDMLGRLKNAMRRAELLGYAVASLAVAILIVIIGIAFLGR